MSCVFDAGATVVGLRLHWSQLYRSDTADINYKHVDSIAQYQAGGNPPVTEIDGGGGRYRQVERSQVIENCGINKLILVKYNICDGYM